MQPVYNASMFPVYDSIQQVTFPRITFLFILLSLAGFIIQLYAEDFDTFVYSYGFLSPFFEEKTGKNALYLLSTLFLSSSYYQILLHVWFLWFAGRSIEPVLRYSFTLIMYLTAGIASILATYVVEIRPGIPYIGLSGVVASALGAYVIHFRKHTLHVLFPVKGSKEPLIAIPLSSIIIYWIILQIPTLFTRIEVLTYPTIPSLIIMNTTGLGIGLLFGILANFLSSESNDDA